VPAKREFKIAVLDDYQNVALSMADWSTLNGRAAITVFNDISLIPMRSWRASGLSRSSV
jgi:hypothetical protein